MLSLILELDSDGFAGLESTRSLDPELVRPCYGCIVVNHINLIDMNGVDVVRLIAFFGFDLCRIWTSTRTV